MGHSRRMVRLVEVALFLAPFALFLVWRTAVPQGAPSRAMVIGATCMMLAVLASLIILRRRDAEPPDAVYVPAHLQDGRIIPGDAGTR